MDLTFLIALSDAQIAARSFRSDLIGSPDGNPVTDAERVAAWKRTLVDISEADKSNTLWAKLGLKLTNCVSKSEGQEIWQKAATGEAPPGSLYAITDVNPRAGRDDTLFVLRWRFAGKFTTPLQLQYYPLDSQLLYCDVHTTRNDEVLFASARELADFRERWRLRRQGRLGENVPVDFFKVDWVGAPASCEFQLQPQWGDLSDRAKQMEPPNVWGDSSAPDNVNTHRRFSFIVYRRPADTLLNIVLPVFFCTGLGLLTAIGPPLSAGVSTDGDFGTSASFFLASVSVRSLTMASCPKVSVVSLLEGYLLASMCLHVVAFVEKFTGLSGGGLEKFLWFAFCTLNVAALAVCFYRQKLNVKSANVMPCANGCGAVVPLDASGCKMCVGPGSPRLDAPQRAPASPAPPAQDAPKKVGGGGRGGGGGDAQLTLLLATAAAAAAYYLKGM